MNADKARICEQLSAYLDGELGEAEGRQVRQAVQADEELARELRALASVRQALRDLPREPAGEDFVARVMERAERTVLVRPAEHQPPGSLRWIRWLATAAVLLVAASVGILIAMALWAPPGFDDRLAYRDAPAGRPGPPAAPTPDDRERTGMRDIAAGTPPDLRGRAGAEDGARLARRDLGEAGEAAYGKVAIVGGADRGRKAGETTADGALARASGRSTATEAALLHDEAIVSGSGKSGSDLTGALAIVGQDVSNEIIYTDRLGETQRQIESVLVANGIVGVAAQGAEPLGATAGDRQRPQAQVRSNVYFSNRLAANAFQYDVYVEPEQLAKVQQALKTIRAGQRVPQLPAASAAVAPRDEQRRQEADESGVLTLARAEAAKEAERVPAGRAKALGEDGPGPADKLDGVAAAGQRRPPRPTEEAAGPARPAAPTAPEPEGRTRQEPAPAVRLAAAPVPTPAPTAGRQAPSAPPPPAPAQAPATAPSRDATVAGAFQREAESKAGAEIELADLPKAAVAPSAKPLPVAVAAGGGVRSLAPSPASAPASTARPDLAQSEPAAPDRTWWARLREGTGRILAPRVAALGERAPAGKRADETEGHKLAMARAQRAGDMKWSPVQSSPALEPLAPGAGAAGRGLAVPQSRPAARPQPVQPTTAQTWQLPSQEKLAEAATGLGQFAHRFRAGQPGGALQTAPGGRSADANGRQAPADQAWGGAVRLFATRSVEVAQGPGPRAEGPAPQAPQSRQVARLQRLLITVNFRPPEDSQRSDAILKSNLESRPADKAAPR